MNDFESFGRAPKLARRGGCLFASWSAFCALLGLAVLSFLGWLAYLLVMHFTH